MTSKRYRRAAVGAFLLIALVAWGYWEHLRAAPVKLASLSSQEWRDDLHSLSSELVHRHANPFHRISQVQFDGLVAQIDSAIPRLRPWETLLRFAQLAATIGDAHTYVSLPSPQHFYPFGVYYFGPDARVIRTTADQQDLLGARLIRVDSASLSEVQARLDRILTQGENRSFYAAHYPWFLSVEILHALGVVPDTTAAAFTFLRDDGSVVIRRLAPLATDPSDWRRPYSRAPLFLQHGQDDFWFDTLPQTRTLYVIFNSYHHLRENAARLFSYLDQHPIDRVVIDLRENGGGDYLEGYKYLVKPLASRAAINARGHLFVITGRYTFSAAMNNAAQFRTDTRAILVGEPPGEVPNSYQERRSFRLPHSHLEVNYSSAYYRFLPEDVPALVPDHSVPPDWSDYRDGKDPALSWILAYSGGPGP